ncbi:MAG: NUDIX hydrolase [Candidatus Spechtbacterales bacterium]|nr:NUDIX hydrolase [Candidatus Spechtbacterales bacterium]
MKYTASGIIINKDKKILLIQRTDTAKEFPGFWDLPGGKSEKGESPEETAIREVKEEVNLDFKPSEILIATKYKNLKEYKFTGKWTGSIIPQKSEVKDYRWFSYKDAINIPLSFNCKKVIGVLKEKELIS